MPFFNRSNQTAISGWWYTVDRISLLMICILIILGVIACATASPPVALRIGSAPNFFLKQHLTHAVAAILLMLILSFLTPRRVKILAIPCVLLMSAVMIITPIYGVEIKGARRWLVFFGTNIQPSEFMRPWLVIATAWLLEVARVTESRLCYFLSIGLYAFSTLCLLVQPDVGMAFMVAAVWLTQVFVSRINVTWILAIGAFLLMCCMTSYLFLPHVQRRVHGFLNTSNKQENYQITKSLDAFGNGGLLGLGPGQGFVKNYIPDSHSDFIFSVIGEEFGLLMCLCIMSLYCFIVINSILRARRSGNPFCISATVGLAIQLQLQVLTNIGVVTRLLPTTGVTMPLISYGGSSMTSTAIALGIMLALTKNSGSENLMLPKLQSWTLSSGPSTINYNG